MPIRNEDNQKRKRLIAAKRIRPFDTRLAKNVGQSKCKKLIASYDVLCQINHTEYRKQHKYAKKNK